MRGYRCVIFSLIGISPCASCDRCSLLRIRLRNDLYCVRWGVKLYSLTQLTAYICCSRRMCNVLYILWEHSIVKVLKRTRREVGNELCQISVERCCCSDSNFNFAFFTDIEKWRSPKFLDRIHWFLFGRSQMLFKQCLIWHMVQYPFQIIC